MIWFKVQGLKGEMRSYTAFLYCLIYRDYTGEIRSAIFGMLISLRFIIFVVISERVY